MDNTQAIKEISLPVSTPKNPATEITTKNKISLGKRKKLDALDDDPGNGLEHLDSVTREPRKKNRKVTHSKMIDEESEEKMIRDVILNQRFVQTKKASACGNSHTITLSDDGTAYSFGINEEGALGLGHNDDVSVPTPIPNLPKINMISCGRRFTVCVDHAGFIWSFGENNFGQLGTINKTNFNVLKSF